jgi:nucleotide-binding universal stress UspA family protein
MFRTIVFAYDGSAEGWDALNEGIELASRFDAVLHLLAVVPPLPPMALSAGPLPDDLIDSRQAVVNDVLATGLALLRRAGLEAVGTTKMWTDPAEAIGAYAREVDADLVIVGHHRRSALDRWWHGSTGHSLLDRLPCSLFVSMPRAAASRPS